MFLIRLLDVVKQIFAQIKSNPDLIFNEKLEENVEVCIIVINNYFPLLNVGNIKILKP